MLPGLDALPPQLLGELVDDEFSDGASLPLFFLLSFWFLLACSFFSLLDNRFLGTMPLAGSDGGGVSVLASFDGDGGAGLAVDLLGEGELGGDASFSVVSVSAEPCFGLSSFGMLSSLAAAAAEDSDLTFDQTDLVSLSLLSPLSLSLPLSLSWPSSVSGVSPLSPSSSPCSSL